MAEPARKLPDDPASPTDPNVFYIHGAQPPPDDEDLGEEDEVIQEPDQDDNTIDIRDQIEERLKKEKQPAEQPEKITQPEIEKPPVQEPPPAENPELAKRRQEKAEQETEKVKRGEQNVKKATGDTGKKVGDELRGAAGKEAKVAGRGGLRAGLKSAGKATGEAAEQMAKRAAAQVEKIAVQFLAKSPWGWAIIGGILLVVIIFAIIFALFAFSGEGGKGPAQYPETALQKQQSNFLLASSGDKVATDTVVKQVTEAELARYDRIKLNTDQHDPQLSQSIAEKKTQFDLEFRAVLVEQSLERRRILLDAVEKKMLEFEAALPFGKWIAAIAIDKVGDENLEFCTITKAGAGVACASFTSTVLYTAGTPNPIVPNTTAIWENPALQLVINRSPTMSPTVYDESKLKPGDIIWWGNGTCSSVQYPEKLFDHVGFYVGGDQAVDTSSGEGVVKKRSVTNRSSKRCAQFLFNGAKRYGG